MRKTTCDYTECVRDSPWRTPTPTWRRWTRTWAIASLRVSPGIWLSYLLPDQRGNRAPGERAYPLARPRLDEGDREGPSRAGSGRAHLPGFVRGGERGRRQLLSALESDDPGQGRGRAA